MILPNAQMTSDWSIKMSSMASIAPIEQRHEAQLLTVGSLDTIEARSSVSPKCLARLEALECLQTPPMRMHLDVLYGFLLCLPKLGPSSALGLIN